MPKYREFFHHGASWMALTTPDMETKRTRMSNLIMKLAVFRRFLHAVTRRDIDEMTARLPIKMISMMTTTQMRAPVTPSYKS